ncbi:ribonuclease P protein subunit p25 [Sminthopsis crassicaudata]|uniref:ribonuclease P protein subunit p25 n=1 Tax=Sminthopsis crassicaudata TaxID=9301 RepID=UPI003D686914
MENFKKVRTEEADTEAESLGPFADLAPGAVEMKVKEGSKIRNLLGFAAARMEQPATRTIVFSGCGRAVTKTVTCVEILKRRLAGLHQVTRLRYRSLREVWESRPPPPGCPGPSLSVHKNVPAVSILLSKDALDPGQPGYQPPEPRPDARIWAPALAPAPPAAPGLKRGPGSPAAEERASKRLQGRERPGAEGEGSWDGAG